MAVTGWRHLRHRPVDFVILFYFIFLLDPWLLLAGDISVLARLNLFTFAELLHDYYCLLLELSCGLCLLVVLC